MSEQELEIQAFMAEMSDPKKTIDFYEELWTKYGNPRAAMKLGMIYCSGKCGNTIIVTRDCVKGNELIESGTTAADPTNPMDQKLLIDLGLFVGGGDSIETGVPKIPELEKSVKLLKIGLGIEPNAKGQRGNKDNLEGFYQADGIKHVEDYLKNREALLENERYLKRIGNA